MFNDIFTLNGRWNRLNRQRYFFYSILLLVAAVVVSVILNIIFIGDMVSAELAPGATPEEAMDQAMIMIGPVFAIQGFIFLILLWPSICLGTKRLHDLDKTGWLWLLLLVPIVSLFFGLYMLFAAGTPGKNRFGPNPLEQ